MSSISGLESVLSQMRSLSVQAASRPTAMSPIGMPSSKSEGGFAAALANAVKDVSAAQTGAELKSRDFQLGQSTVSLNDVMIDMQKASLGFQSIVQVRNKIVAAYHTIASMPM